MVSSSEVAMFASLPLLAVLATVLPATALAQAFPDFHEPAPPTGWTGPVFQLSQDYPSTRPQAETLPWKTINFKTRPADYLNAVLNYCYDGNIAVDWRGQDNPVRKWYHAPWLHSGDKGREFVRGTTRERTTPPSDRMNE
jgi:hypothetical protein